MIEPDHVRCPRCLSEVVFRPGQVACSSCGAIYPMAWDIPLLSENPDFYYCPTAPRWLSEQLERTRRDILADPERHFPPLLQAIVDRIPDNARKPIWIENLVDESRAVAKYLTAMHPEHHVLNLGCGWDNTTINMARTVRKVSALDLTRQRVQLLALKKRYYGLDNIDLFCGGDTAHLPFADNSFDAVFLNGVLEWVAADFSGEEAAGQGLGRPAKCLRYLRAVYTRHRPRRIQERFLGEVRRVLKESGEVFIGIENRYSREYFRGRKDHHSYLRFGSVVPRLAAHLMSLWSRHRPYLTFTYSHGGYRSLLARAGLPLRRIYALEPDYRRPSQLIDLARRGPIRRFTRRASSGLGLMPAWLYRRTAPSFGMVGTGGAAGHPWIERAVDDFGHRMACRCRLEAITCNRKGKLALTVASGGRAGRSWLLKVPVSPMAQLNCERHFDGLAEVRTRAGKDPELAPLLPLLPEPVHRGALDDQPYFAETMCAGRPWSETAPEDGDRALWEELCRCLTLLGRLPVAPPPAGQELSRLDQKLGLLGEQAGVEPAHQQVLRQLRTVLGAHLQPSPGRAFLRKGDFSLSNVMVADGRVTGLIDFDEWGITSDPLVDGADFLLSWLRHRKNCFWVDGLDLLGRSAGTTESSVLPPGPLLSRLGGTAAGLERSALIAWLDHAWHACRHQHHRLNRRWIKRVVLDVIEAIGSRQSLIGAV